MTSKKKIPITLAIAVVIILCGLISLTIKDVRLYLGLEKTQEDQSIQDEVIFWNNMNIK